MNAFICSQFLFSFRFFFLLLQWCFGCSSFGSIVMTNLGCHPDTPRRRQPQLRDCFCQTGPWARLWDLVSNDDWSGSAQPTVGGSILRQVCLAYESRVAEMWAWEQDRKQLLSTAYFLPPGSFLPWAPALVLLVEDELWPTIPNKPFPPQSYFWSLCCYSNRKLTRTDILSFPFFYKVPLLFSLIIKVSTLFMLP